MVQTQQSLHDVEFIYTVRAIALSANYSSQYGCGILLTTHYMDEAQRLCDRLLLLQQGKVIDRGTPAELIERIVGQDSLNQSVTLVFRITILVDIRSSCAAVMDRRFCYPSSAADLPTANSDLAQSMKVLITGGTGFLGQKLATRLRSSYDVSILGRNGIVGKQMKALGCQFLPVDLRDKEATVAACSSQDYVFHCGALSSPWGKYRDFYDTNVLGTRNIIQGCQTHNVQRLIQVSTPSIYFDFSHRLNISESTPLPTPVNAYAKTKQLAEQEIDTAHKSGLPVITIRPRAIFGPGDTSILPRLIKVSDRTGIPLINSGKALLDLTYIDNVVDALLLCQAAPDNLLGRIFNITNGQPMYLIDLLETLFKKLSRPFKTQQISYKTADLLAIVMELASNTIMFGREPLLTRYTVGLLAFSQTLDITAAREELGYQPKVSMEEGLDIFAKWWKETPVIN